MVIKEIKLANGFSCFVGRTVILFNTLDGQLTVPTITFCKMDFQSAKNWLMFAGLEITRADFRDIYIKGDLTLANLLGEGLIHD